MDIKKIFDQKLKEEYIENNPERIKEFRNDKYDVYFKDDRKDYLLSIMSDSERKAFLEGEGGELKEKENGIPPKMLSIASSSAFCFNALRIRDIEKEEGIRFLEKEGENITFVEFEKRLPIIENCCAPSMDAYTISNLREIFIECKCHEIFDNRQIKLSKSYFNEGLFVNKIDNKYLTSVEASYLIDPKAFGISDRLPFFDVKQCLTHIMGIIKNKKEGMHSDLIYILHFPKGYINDEIEEHEKKFFKEINIFLTSNIIKEVCHEYDISIYLYINKGEYDEPCTKVNTLFQKVYGVLVKDEAYFYEEFKAIYEKEKDDRLITISEIQMKYKIGYKLADVIYENIHRYENELINIMTPSLTKTKEAEKERYRKLKEELDYINNNCNPLEFLILNKICNLIKKDNMMFYLEGPLANSHIAYELGITEIDTYRYGIDFYLTHNPDFSKTGYIELNVNSKYRELLIEKLYNFNFYDRKVVRVLVSLKNGTKIFRSSRLAIILDNKIDDVIEEFEEDGITYRVITEENLKKYKKETLLVIIRSSIFIDMLMLYGYDGYKDISVKYLNELIKSKEKHEIFRIFYREVFNDYIKHINKDELTFDDYVTYLGVINRIPFSVEDLDIIDRESFLNKFKNDYSNDELCKIINKAKISSADERYSKYAYLPYRYYLIMKVKRYAFLAMKYMENKNSFNRKEKFIEYHYSKEKKIHM